MKNITLFGSFVEVTSAFLNTLQKRALGLLALNKNNDLIASDEETIGGVWQLKDTTAGIPTATLVQLDDQFDWRDRMVWGQIIMPTADDRAGQAGDTDLDWKASPSAGYFGYLGTGAYSNTAGAGTAVSNGSKPLRGVGGVRSYFVNLSGTVNTIFLYCEPGTGKLFLYNDTGSTIYPVLTVLGTGKTGKR
jgi:hypothetical protein